MTQDKFNEIIMHLLINTQTEILALKDILLADIMEKNNHGTPEQIAAFEKRYDKLRLEIQTELIAKIREKYDDTLGSVDDLLNSLF